MVLIILFLIWIIGGIISYQKFISKWDKSLFERIWFSMIWFLTAILYGIHWIHNK